MPAPQSIHKRKRSIQDSPVDISKTRQASIHLAALKEELEGIQETEAEMNAITQHMGALEDILSKAAKPKVSFSIVSDADLEKLGVIRGRLIINNSVLKDIGQQVGSMFAEEISNLDPYLSEMDECVNMDHEAGARMVLDAILLSLRRLTITDKKSDVAILPEFNVTPAEGVRVSNIKDGYELYFTGSFDYAVVQYEAVDDHRDRLISPGGSRDDVFKISNGRLFLVRSKCQALPGATLASYRAEAVSQAISAAVVGGLKQVRFCLSNGKTWIFFVLKHEDDVWSYYESAARQLSPSKDGSHLHTIIVLLSCWLEGYFPSELYRLDRA
ncbi:hypothetical protein P691DRAFT_808967 [Macrolepiota fuliginosa MF-IS2]|uniref:Uncharacterized protein n=1 Tax=Macrolepiota fuliginosa MF-IS2 TaxID=1400762 RepID=A0A9P5X269_9AGAR|nr:hypothetical protein P691DRAFT_808967 [Macrolepiota fuliginosa MF-IS2]